MSAALETARGMLTMQGKPAYVEFRTVAKHLPKRSKDEGRYIAVDVDQAIVRQIGANDSTIFEVTAWLAQNDIDVQANRLPPQHADFYRESYKRWKSGQEMPVEGTPIKSWPVISPAQVAVLLDLRIRTVEDLSQLPDDGIRRIGMGGIQLKQMAKAWLEQGHDKGEVTLKVSALESENALLKANLASLEEKFDAFKLQAESGGKSKKKINIEE